MTSQTQMNDWITAVKVNETNRLTSAMLHLISWQTNLVPVKNSTLTQWVGYYGWDTQASVTG